MKFLPRLASLLPCALILAACAHTETQGSPITALVGAKVIDGTGAPRSEQPWTVLIQGERILAAGPRVKAPRGASVIDVSGKTLLPGLVDMHAHFYANVSGVMKNVFEAYPPLFLAGGVTTARSVGDLDPEGTYELKQKIARGEVAGPRLLMGGYYIDNAPGTARWFKPVKNPEEAVARIEEWKDRIDVVKFYANVTDEEMAAGIAAARRLGIPTTAHLGSITAGRAIDLGIGALEHGISTMSELIADIPRDPKSCKRARIDLDSPQVDALIDKIVSHRVGIDPTFVILMNLPDTPPVPPDWRDYFAEQKAADFTLSQDDPSWTAEMLKFQHDCTRATHEKGLQLVKKIQDRGGIILTGTDPVWPAILPGWGLHREMKYLTDAGLTPLQAIRAATYNAALILGKDKDQGTVAASKLADLIVVSGDPSRRIEDIGNTEMVFKGGQRFDPKALRASAKGKIR